MIFFLISEGVPGYTKHYLNTNYVRKTWLLCLTWLIWHGYYSYYGYYGTINIFPMIVVSAVDFMIWYDSKYHADIRTVNESYQL